MEGAGDAHVASAADRSRKGRGDGNGRIRDEEWTPRDWIWACCYVTTGGGPIAAVRPFEVSGREHGDPCAAVRAVLRPLP